MDDLTGLGRRHAPDPRDRQYLLPKRAASERTYRTWSSAGVLDQGNSAMCVGFSTWKYLQTSPVINKPKKLTPEVIYREAQKADEWPGEDYDGTSVRAAFKVLKSLGYVSEYRWAYDTETVIRHVLDVGPVVMGTAWYMDMFQWDRWGYIWPEGENVGGHAWCIMGANRARKNPDGTVGAVRMVNSWGASWGQSGRAWLSLNSLARLIAEDGEACVATEVKVAE